MTEAIRRHLMSRGTLLVLVVGLAFALVVVATYGIVSRAGAGGPGVGSDGPAPNPSGVNTSGLDLSAPNLSNNEAPGAPVSLDPSSPLMGAQPSGSPASLAPQYGPGGQGGIWVTGQGKVTATPDLAILNVGVEVSTSTVVEANSQAAQAMSDMMQVLTDRNIETGDIQTRSFNIRSDYRWNDVKREEELAGYVVSNQLVVKIRDIDSVGSLIDALVAAGGDYVRVRGVDFAIEDTKALEVQARELAVEDLMAKAQQIADLAGVRLGRPVFLSEGGGFAPLPIGSFLGGDDRAYAYAQETAQLTLISGGQLTVTVNVQGGFSIYGYGKKY
jgi:uncharacterized protein YggE